MAWLDDTRKRFRQLRGQLGQSCSAGAATQHIAALEAELKSTHDELDAALKVKETAQAECEAIRVALRAYPDSNLESLAKLYHDIYTFRMARCDSGDCETLEMYRRNQGAIRYERIPVCLGCGKTHADCECTEEEIEYHKQLEREEKAR